ncbi:MAG: hypothetical protein D6741_21485, partial [Planctomycetota bacterium]
AETSPLWPSLLYGVGTGLPVLLFALVIAFAAQQLGKAFNILTKIELAVRYGSGAIFILIGIYFVLRHNFGLLG